jgi:Protein of unknown function (DUF1553)/Protein of unknown function (DUF1549)/Planctomycete cytochrome C
MRNCLTAFALLLAAIGLTSITAQEKANPFKKKLEEFRQKKMETASTGFADKLTAEQEKFFEAKIRPVLIEQCYECHAADSKKIRANLTLDSREGLRKGGDSGPAIVAGNPAKSLLIEVMTTKDADRQMPPKKKLAENVIEDFKTWVKMGAPDPRDGGKIAKQEIDIEAGRKFWAFQPPKKQEMKKEKGKGKNEIDELVSEQWTKKGLTPVAAAEKHTLVRRLYLDLVGLPPTPEEVDAFVNDKSTDALAKLTDKLLASPAFGERWGRHWLDVARFAESTGKSVNFNYPHAWRYRDYVIAAYNADKPFDLFVKEQLAGDLLPAKDEADKAENIVATGFLAIGTKTLNERNRLQFELDLVDEQIDAFSQAFLGITAACARCHDHKFDPIPTKDYYALAGIFRSTETCYGTIRAVQGQHPSPLITLPKTSDDDGLKPMSSTERERLQKQLDDIKKELADLQKKSLQDSFLSMNGVRLRIQSATLEAKLDLYEKDGTPKRLAMGTRERLRGTNSPVYQRGEPEKPGEIVPRGFLQVMNTNTQINSGSGRLELANWVASKDNPLTARVYVNRVWLHLFGRGLVATPDNFGTTGTPPSNPALLDHLAIWFMENDWSTKKLIKYLVTTNAYQLSTKFDAKSYEADPENALVWRMTPGRLDAEVIRDSLLSISGNLDRKPAKGSPVHAAGEGYAVPRGPRPAIFGGAPPDETHRSVYLPIVRDNVPESLSLFDSADPNLIVGDRTNTTVPSQALFLMNNPFVIKQAEATAEKLIEKTSTDSQRVREAYRLFYGRTPTAKEQTTAEAFLTSYGAKHPKKATWTAFTQAMFGSAEFLMRN